MQHFSASCSKMVSVPSNFFHAFIAGVGSSELAIGFETLY
jgi:hypothetical protein